jgi:glutamine cyclotransferase
MKNKAEVLQEYGPFQGAPSIGGVSYDGTRVWCACGDSVRAFDPATGETQRTLDIAAHAGTAFDGTHLWQIVEKRIVKLDPDTGQVLASIPAPGNGGDSGMAWAEGSLWVGEHRARRIHQVDPQTGKVLRSIESNRFVTGVTWVDGQMWHGTWENDESEIRRVDVHSGAVQEALVMPAGMNVSGLEADGKDRFYCGGGRTGKVRAVRIPRRA